MRLDINKVSSAMSKRTGSVTTATLEGHKEVGKVSKVVVSFNREPAQHEARIAIAGLFNNKASVVPNSFRRIKDVRGRVTMAGFVSLNVLSQPLTKERAGQMREIASNIMMDNVDESVWKVTESASGQKFVSRNIDEDLAELVAMASMKNISSDRIPVLCSLDTVSVVNKYVAFINPETATLDYGYQVADNIVVSSDSDTIVEDLDDDMIVDSVEIDDPENSDDEDVQARIDHVLSAYSSDPDFYIELESKFEQRSAA